MGKSTAAAVPVAPKNRENKVSGGLIEINNNASGVFLNTLIIRVICLAIIRSRPRFSRIRRLPDYSRVMTHYQSEVMENPNTEVLYETGEAVLAEAKILLKFNINYQCLQSA
ncbi:hypothetical protein QTP88_004876 [Uroleucon formosanum]